MFTSSWLAKVQSLRLFICDLQETKATESDATKVAPPYLGTIWYLLLPSEIRHGPAESLLLPVGEGVRAGSCCAGGPGVVLPPPDQYLSHAITGRPNLTWEFIVGKLNIFLTLVNGQIFQLTWEQGALSNQNLGCSGQPETRGALPCSGFLEKDTEVYSLPRLQAGA